MSCEKCGRRTDDQEEPLNTRICHGHSAAVLDKYFFRRIPFEARQLVEYLEAYKFSLEDGQEDVRALHGLHEAWSDLGVQVNALLDTSKVVIDQVRKFRSSR